MPRSLVWGAWLPLAVLVAGCGGHFVARGSELYGERRYVEAAEVFERSEVDLSNASARDRARFGLYRGATYLHLGDRAHAARWLRFAANELGQEKAALSAKERSLLEASLATLTEMPPSVSELRAVTLMATHPIGPVSGDTGVPAVAVP